MLDELLLIHICGPFPLPIFGINFFNNLESTSKHLLNISTYIIQHIYTLIYTRDFLILPKRFQLLYFV
jgi:hypothetical protein